MILIINTTNDKLIELVLAKSQDDFKVKKIRGERQQSEKLLVGIDKFLKQYRISPLSQGENPPSASRWRQREGVLKAIGVVTGPGGFTSLRIGVAVANTLGYALKVPIMGIKLNEFKNNDELVKKIIFQLKARRRRLAFKPVLPQYGREPNITSKK